MSFVLPKRGREPSQTPASLQSGPGLSLVALLAGYWKAQEKVPSSQKVSTGPSGRVFQTGLITESQLSEYKCEGLPSSPPSHSGQGNYSAQNLDKLTYFPTLHPHPESEGIICEPAKNNPNVLPRAAGSHLGIDTNSDPQWLWGWKHPWMSLFLAPEDTSFSKLSHINHLEFQAKEKKPGSPSLC